MGEEKKKTILAVLIGIAIGILLFDIAFAIDRFVKAEEMHVDVKEDVSPKNCWLFPVRNEHCKRQSRKHKYTITIILCAEECFLTPMNSKTN